MQSEPISSQSAQRPLELLSNGVPLECQSFRKIQINVNSAKQGASEASEFQGIFELPNHYKTFL